MRIEVWADVVCPWAYIGKRRLERCLAGAPTVEVVWRPFRIDPTAPAPGAPLDAVLRDPMVDDALRACAPDLTADENRVRVSRIAADEGLGPRWGAAWRASSQDAHRLIALAYEGGGAALQDIVVEAVLQAHFVDAVDISDRAVLARVVAPVFADAPQILADGTGAELVRDLLLQGRARGVRTSPTFVVGARAVAGAQPPEILRDLLSGGKDGRSVPEEVERFRWAESLLDQGDPLGALTMLRPLLDEHASDRGVRMLAARAWFASAQLRRARAALQALVADDPSDAYARVLLGRTLERMGLGSEAALHLRVATAMVPAWAALAHPAGSASSAGLPSPV
jgi:predicted DsbA family dithiol-disulfide isomerase